MRPRRYEPISYVRRTVLDGKTVGWRLTTTKPMLRTTAIPQYAPRTPSALGLGACVCGSLALTFLGYGVGGERRWLSVTRHEVGIPALVPAWDGMRLVQLSDFHFGAPGNPEAMIRRAIETAIALHPDLILLTGDYSHDGTPIDLDMLRPLACAAPTVAVLGNHDYYRGQAGANGIASALAGCGIAVLRNALFDFTYNGVAGKIAGFEQGGGGITVDVSDLLRQVHECHPQIALVHEPDMIERFPIGAVGLTLAGHTHGAQVRLSPLRGIDWIRWVPLECRSRYPRGWFRVDDNHLYVSRGLGISGLPVRLAARPELASFVLRTIPAADRKAQRIQRKRKAFQSRRHEEHEEIRESI